MTLISAPDAATSSASAPGTLGRLGTWVIDHRRVVTAVWLLFIIGLGAFAPGVERSLSGAGWQADQSESVAVRKLVQQHFDGQGSYAIQVVVHSDGPPLAEGDGPHVIARVSQMLDQETRLTDVVQPVPGVSISADGRTAILLAGSRVDSNEMVRVADDLKQPLQRACRRRTVQVNPTGASVLWSDFNEANLHAMLGSELQVLAGNHADPGLAFGALVPRASRSC